MTARKAIPKRLRFEILRRDNHACRYCGQMAPEVKLTVDHVIPVVLGGSDDPSNIVTACVDCNAGKSSVPLGASMVDDISRHAQAWSSARDEVMNEWREETAAANELGDLFIHYWKTWRWCDQDIPYDPKWRQTVAFWVKQGLTVDDLCEMVEKAMTKDGVAASDTWRYFCGIVWRTLEKIDERTAAKIAAPQPTAFHAAPHPSSRYVEPADLPSDQDEWLMEMHLDDAEARYGEPRDVRAIFAQMFGGG